MNPENVGFVQEQSDSHTKKKPSSLILKEIELLQSLGLGYKWLKEDVFQRLSHELVAALRGCSGTIPTPSMAIPESRAVWGWERPTLRAQGPTQGQTQRGLALLDFAQALQRGGFWGRRAPQGTGLWHWSGVT